MEAFFLTSLFHSNQIRPNSDFAEGTPNTSPNTYLCQILGYLSDQNRIYDHFWPNINLFFMKLDQRFGNFVCKNRCWDPVMGWFVQKSSQNEVLICMLKLEHCVARILILGSFFTNRLYECTKPDIILCYRDQNRGLKSDM